MLRTMTSRQFVEWQLFAEAEPFGEERMDYRFASLAQILMNTHRDPKAHPSPYTIEEARLMFGDAERLGEKQTWQDMLLIAKQVTAGSKGN